MARVARSGEDIGRKAREIRQALHRDGEGAAPCIIKAYVFEVWVDIDHWFAHGFVDIGEFISVTFSAAEEEAIV